MPDYSKGKIYEIVCNITKEKYIGSTISGLSKRKAQHKEKRKTTATQIIDRNDYYINLVENYPCDNKEQLLKREREWIEKGGCINKHRPIITKEEDRQRDTERLRRVALNRTEEEWNVVRAYDRNRYAEKIKIITLEEKNIIV
jgi:hypothetical protein